MDYIMVTDAFNGEPIAIRVDKITMFEGMTPTYVEREDDESLPQMTRHNIAMSNQQAKRYKDAHCRMFVKKDTMAQEHYDSKTKHVINHTVMHVKETFDEIVERLIRG